MVKHMRLEMRWTGIQERGATVNNVTGTLCSEEFIKERGRGRELQTAAVCKILN